MREEARDKHCEELTEVTVAGVYQLQEEDKLRSRNLHVVLEQPSVEEQCKLSKF
jgi:hypothetical protein